MEVKTSHVYCKIGIKYNNEQEGSNLQVIQFSITTNTRPQCARQLKID